MNPELWALADQALRNVSVLADEMQLVQSSLELLEALEDGNDIPSALIRLRVFLTHFCAAADNELDQLDVNLNRILQGGAANE